MAVTDLVEFTTSAISRESNNSLVPKLESEPESFDIFWNILAADIIHLSKLVAT